MKSETLISRLKLALNEDHAHQDVTSLQLPYNKEKINAKIISKGRGYFCGGFLIKSIFGQLDPRITIQVKVKDGSKVAPGQTLAKLRGQAQAILSGERVYLNLATHLSGITTLTRKFVDAVKGTGAQILDTRKTMPLWRDLERTAVRVGGGRNHRNSLGDAILIKDNHLKVIRQKPQTLTQLYGVAKLNGHRKKIEFLEIEAQTLKDVWEGIKIRADIIMLDNMPTGLMKKAIEFIKAARRALDSGKPWIEISGGVTLQNVRALAKLGVERISIGALTHSAPALDLSLEVE